MFVLNFRPNQTDLLAVSVYGYTLDIHRQKILNDYNKSSAMFAFNLMTIWMAVRGRSGLS